MLIATRNSFLQRVNKLFIRIRGIRLQNVVSVVEKRRKQNNTKKEKDNIKLTIDNRKENIVRKIDLLVKMYHEQRFYPFIESLIGQKIDTWHNGNHTFLHLLLEQLKLIPEQELDPDRESVILAIQNITSRQVHK